MTLSDTELAGEAAHKERNTRLGRNRLSRPARAVHGATFALAWLLIGPRVTILSLQGSSVRLEDVLLVALLPLAVKGLRVGKDLRRRGIAVVTAVAIVAAVFGTAAGHVRLGPALLYGIRPLEYWIVYPAVLGLLVSEQRLARVQMTKLLAVVTVVQSTTAFLQVALGVQVGFSKFSYQRGAGLTAGPYELGAICAALACFWLARRRYLLVVVACVGLAASASRISIVAFALAGAYIIVRRSRGARRQLASGQKRLSLNRQYALSAVVACALFALVVGTSPLWYQGVAAASVGRIKETSIAAEWTVAGEAAANVAVSSRSDGYQAVAYGDFADAIGEGLVGAQDASNVIRFFRWHLLLSAIGNSWVVGLGPSFAGPSVDGAFLRIVVETGGAGAVAWLLLVRGMYSGAPTWMRAVLLTFVVGSAFIDIPFAMRPMILLWLMVAMSSGAYATVRRAGESEGRSL